MRRILPSDLRLHILEYEGERLELPNKDIIQRIQSYDPSFDPITWFNNVKVKERLIKEATSEAYIDIYQFIKDNKLSMSFSKYEDQDIISVSIDINIVEQLQSLISIAGYEASIIFDPVSRYPYICMDRIDYNNFYIHIITLWSVWGRRGEYRQSSSIIEMFRKITSILSMPSTLSEHLRYILEERKIKENKAFGLYCLLKSRKWNISSSTLTVYHSKDYPIIPEIDKELASVVPIKKITHKNKCRIFHMEKDLNILIQIDRFYHPFTLSSYVSFS